MSTLVITSPIMKLANKGFDQVTVSLTFYHHSNQLIGESMWISLNALLRYGFPEWDGQTTQIMAKIKKEKH